MTTFIDNKTGDRIEVDYNGGDNASSFPRVQVRFPDTPLTINVGHNHVEWGTDRHGMNGADIELDPNGGFLCRFQESSRHLIMDGTGFRVYDADSEVEDRLMLRLDHDAYHAGKPPTLGPASGIDAIVAAAVKADRLAAVDYLRRSRNATALALSDCILMGEHVQG